MHWKNFMIWKKKKIPTTNKSSNYIYKTRLSYFLKSRKKTESKNPKVIVSKNGRIMLLLKCSVCHSEKSKFLQNKEAKGLLGNLMGVKLPFPSDLPILNALL